MRWTEKVPQIQDVAEYILKLHGPMTVMKLQKLCYYAQAWSLVWDDRPLFKERLEAWANGPGLARLQWSSTTAA